MKKTFFTLFALLHKKLILVAGLTGLTVEKFLENVEAKADAAIAFPALAPDYDHDAATIKTKVGAVRTSIALHKTKEDELKTLTKKNEDDLTFLNDVVLGDWMPKTQTAIANDPTKATQMSYTFRGEHDHVAPDVSVWNSHVNLDIAITGSLLHTITAVNNVSKSWHLPEDADCLYLYECYDPANVFDLKKMIFLGVMKKSKFVNHFTADDKGKTVYYVAVYKPKKGDLQPELSVAESKPVV